MSSPAPARAVVAGVLHGVVEWLPVSSSGHVALLIDAAGWPEAEPDRRRERRALEVALHTGSLVPLGRRVLGDLRRADAPGALIAAGLGATAVTSVIGGVGGAFVERRFSGPRSVAAGLVAGSIALVAAERLAQRRLVAVAATSVPAATVPTGPGPAAGTHAARSLAELVPADVLAIGAAQGIAIWPGISRRAATLSAARARGLDPAAADSLSWIVGLPTLLAATLWQFWRTRDDLRRDPLTPLAGAVASGVSGTVAAGLPARTAGWPAARWAAWRVALAAATLRRG